MSVTVEDRNRQRICLDPGLAAALLARRGEFDEPALADGLLTGDHLAAYRRALRDVPGVAELGQRIAADLIAESSEGYLMLGCAALLDGCDDDEQALRLVTVLLCLVGRPLRVFDRWPLWKPLGTNLDIDPMRATGTGYNPMHLDVVNATHPPDYAALLCLRPDPHGAGASLVSHVRRAAARLRPAQMELLREPVFRDGAFYDLTGVGEDHNPFPILDDLPPERGFVRFTAKMLTDRDPGDPHTHAARALERELVAGQRQFLLDRGDLLVVNQHLTCHGREALGERQQDLPDERRRLLCQMFLRRDTLTEDAIEHDTQATVTGGEVPR